MKQTRFSFPWSLFPSENIHQVNKQSDKYILDNNEYYDTNKTWICDIDWGEKY